MAFLILFLSILIIGYHAQTMTDCQFTEELQDLIIINDISTNTIASEECILRQESISILVKVFRDEFNSPTVVIDGTEYFEKRVAYIEVDDIPTVKINLTTEVNVDFDESVTELTATQLLMLCIQQSDVCSEMDIQLRSGTSDIAPAIEAAVDLFNNIAPSSDDLERKKKILIISDNYEDFSDLGITCDDFMEYIQNQSNETGQDRGYENIEVSILNINYLGDANASLFEQCLDDPTIAEESDCEYLPSDIFNQIRDDLCLSSCEQEYIFDDDGIPKTWSQARDLCLTKYNADLATIDTLDDLQCLNGEILDSGGSSAWIGLVSSSRNGEDPKDKHSHIRPYFYQYVDGSSCPELENGKYSGACVGKKYWLNKQPLPCNIGSQCTRLIANDENGKINNDILCDHQISGVLCNAQNSANKELKRCDIVCDEGFGVISCDENLYVDANCECDTYGYPKTECINDHRRLLSKYLNMKPENNNYSLMTIILFVIFFLYLTINYVFEEQKNDKQRGQIAQIIDQL